MSNLLASFGLSANALDVFQQALNVVQNNVSNSSTPGYAKQQLNLEAQPFDTATGLAGGVAAQGLQDSRDQYAEEAVQQQSQALGFSGAQADSTATVQGLFDVSGNSGVPGALTQLLQSFSAWSTTPNDSTARQTVLSSAQNLAQSVNGLASSLTDASRQVDGRIGATVTQINSLAAQIRDYNVARRQQTQPDPGADAQLYSTLESLSQLTNFSTVRQADGTVTVMLSGGTPLVIGDQVNALQSVGVTDSAPPPVTHIQDSNGGDVTSQINGGQLGGLLDTRNRLLTSILGGGGRQGTLNQFAQGLADTVNNILETGTVSTAPGAAKGTALFTYNGADPNAVAATLALNPAITPDQLAAVDAAGTVNGNANQLAALADPSSSAGSIAGVPLVQYYARIAAAVGQENQNATTNQQSQQQILAQTKSLREQVSGVSLDEEAVHMLQFQRAYQAVAHVLTVLNTLADTTLSLIPT